MGRENSWQEELRLRRVKRVTHLETRGILTMSEASPRPRGTPSSTLQQLTTHNWKAVEWGTDRTGAKQLVSQCKKAQRRAMRIRTEASVPKGMSLEVCMSWSCQPGLQTHLNHQPPHQPGFRAFLSCALWEFWPLPPPYQPWGQQGVQSSSDFPNSS